MDIEKVWGEYQGRLKRFLLSKVANKADVDDLLQDILIKVHTGLPTLTQQSSLKSWLFQIANHTIIDFYRSRRSLDAQGVEQLWYQEAEQDIAQELERCIEPFINNLPEDAAQLLTAVDLNGMSQKQFAERHNISYSTLKSRVQKARSLLRKEFDACCSFSLDASGNLMDYQRKSDHCKNC